MMNTRRQSEAAEEKKKYWEEPGRSRDEKRNSGLGKPERSRTNGASDKIKMNGLKRVTGR